jgi:hypothetical protein
MPSSDSERIPCPGCGKTYSWKPELANRKVVCKACNTQFAFPEQPPKPPTVEPADSIDDDGIYDLASDPDEERELPPAYVPATAPSVNDPVASASPENENSSDPAEPAISSGSDEPEEEAVGGEPVAHVSEAKKAARREAQRLAAAEAESIRTWRDYKLLYIVLGLFLLFVLIYTAMYMFSEAMEDGLHNTMRQDQTVVLVCSHTLPPVD